MEMGEIDLKGAAATIADLLTKGWEEKHVEVAQMQAGDAILADRAEFLGALAASSDPNLLLQITSVYAVEGELFHLIALPVSPVGEAATIYRRKEGARESNVC